MRRWALAMALLLASAPTLAWMLVEADKPYVHRWVGYSVQFPPGWKYDQLPDSDERGATREGFLLQTIYIDYRSHATAFPTIGKSSSAESVLRDLAADLLADMTESRGLEDVRLVANESADLAGRPAFRLQFDYLGPPTKSFMFYGLHHSLRYREVVIGAVDERGLYLVGYRAPFLHYFARDFGAYE